MQWMHRPKPKKIQIPFRYQQEESFIKKEEKKIKFQRNVKDKKINAKYIFIFLFILIVFLLKLIF